LFPEFLMAWILLRSALRLNGWCVQRICNAILPAAIMLFSAGAVLAADAPASRLDDDVAMTKATVSLLAARDIAAVRSRLDPIVGPVSDDVLRKLSDMVAANEPTSIETIYADERRNLQTGDGSSRVLLEYAYPGKWVLVDVAIRSKDNQKHFFRLFLTPNGVPLREANRFYFFGKGPAQYLFLAAWLAAIALVGWAIKIAFRRHTGWRRWVLIAAMPLGLTPTLAMNWNTAEMWVTEAINNPAGRAIPIFAVRWPMVMLGRTEFLVPYFMISAPLFAVGYLIWYWRRGRRVKVAETEAIPQPASNTSGHDVSGAPAEIP
jgi:hypothetical protein